MIRLLVALVMFSGCTFGIGSAHVGQWRAHRERVLDACLEDETGTCVDKKSVDVDLPARRYWGFKFEFPLLGPAVVDGKVAMRMETAGEALVGRGSFALGIRGGAIIDVNRQWAANVMATGHYAVTPRLSMRAGIGYTPWAATSPPFHDGEMQQVTHVGARALVGLQFVLARTQQENFLILSVDVDRMYLAFDTTHVASGLVSSIGLYF